MTIEKVGVGLLLTIHHADIIRLKDGPDRIVLQTNLPNPCWPFSGTLSITILVSRYGGQKWLQENLPQLREIEVFDGTKARGVLRLSPIAKPV